MRTLPGSAPLRAALILLLLGAAAFAGDAAGAIPALLPIVALLLPLAFGRFPGERAIERLAARVAARRRPRAPRVLAARTGRDSARSRARRSGRLAGTELAVRPPPAATPA